MVVLVLCSGGGGGGGGYYCSFFVVSAEESRERFVTYMSNLICMTLSQICMTISWSLAACFLPFLACTDSSKLLPLSISLSLYSCSSSSSPWLFLSFSSFFSFFLPASSSSSSWSSDSGWYLIEQLCRSKLISFNHDISYGQCAERERERNWKKQWRLGGREDGSRCKFCETLL